MNAWRVTSRAQATRFGSLLVRWSGNPAGGPSAGSFGGYVRVKLLAEAAPARAAPELTASHSGSYVLRVVELDERAAREDAVLTRGNARVERGR